ncbi:MAG: hypothetical protein HC836_25845 [Richelia sp. RM2_1_2]|nr:hypothetical protein [Richelia sp. RM2_1_2]
MKILEILSTNPEWDAWIKMLMTDKQFSTISNLSSDFLKRFHSIKIDEYRRSHDASIKQTIKKEMLELLDRAATNKIKGQITVIKDLIKLWKNM